MTLDAELKLIIHDINNNLLEVSGRLHQLDNAIERLISNIKKIAAKLDES